MARKVVKDTKKEAWRQFCSTIGRETNLDKMWKMVKKMTGKYKPAQIPVLIDKQNQAVNDICKANMLGKEFANIHKGNHLDVILKKKERRNFE